MKKINYLFVSCILILVSSLIGKVNAQTTLSGRSNNIFSGVIVDKHSAEALPGVVVKLYGTKTAAVTDIEGKFSLKLSDESLRQDSVKFGIEHTGYISQVINLSVNNIPSNLEIYMVDRTIDPKKKAAAGEKIFSDPIYDNTSSTPQRRKVKK